MDIKLIHDNENRDITRTGGWESDLDMEESDNEPYDEKDLKFYKNNSECYDYIKDIIKPKKVKKNTTRINNMFEDTEYNIESDALISGKVIGKPIGINNKKTNYGKASDVLVNGNSEITEELCIEAFNEDVNMIKFIPSEFITKEMCVKAFDKNIDMIEFIPRDFLTQEMCIKAFNKCIGMIEYIPEEFITENMCIRLYKHMYIELSGDMFAAKYIPDRFKTYEMYIYMLKSNDYTYLYNIPNKLKTKELCHCAIKKYPPNFENFNMEMIDENDIHIIEKYFEKNKRCDNLNYKKKLHKIFELLVKYDPYGCLSRYDDGCIPEKYITEKMYFDAYKAGYNYWLIPERFRTKKLKDYIKNNNLSDMVYFCETVPYDVFLKAIEEGDISLNNINPESITHKLLMDIIEIDIRYFKDIKEYLITHEMCDYVLSKDVDQFAYISKNLITREMCDYVFSKDMAYLAYMPDKYITREMCISVFSKITSPSQVEWRLINQIIPKSIMGDWMIKMFMDLDYVYIINRFFDYFSNDDIRMEYIFRYASWISKKIYPIHKSCLIYLPFYFQYKYRAYQWKYENVIKIIIFAKN